MKYHDSNGFTSILMILAFIIDKFTLYYDFKLYYGLYMSFCPLGSAIFPELRLGSNWGHERTIIRKSMTPKTKNDFHTMITSATK